MSVNSRLRNDIVEITKKSLREGKEGNKIGKKMDKKNCDGTQYPKHALKCKRTQHSECWHGIITLLPLLFYQHRLCDDRKVIIFGGNEESNQSFDCSFNAGVLMKYYTVRWFVGDVELTFSKKKERRRRRRMSLAGRRIRK